MSCLCPSETRSVAVRNKALHALGHAREAWAVDLVVAALTEEATRAAAVEALAGLGEEALEILSGLIADHEGNPRLLLSCIEAAAGLDPVAAIELVLPLAWHADAAVRRAAPELPLGVQILAGANHAALAVALACLAGAMQAFAQTCPPASQAPVAQSPKATNVTSPVTFTWTPSQAAGVVGHLPVVAVVAAERPVGRRRSCPSTAASQRCSRLPPTRASPWKC